MLFYDLMLVSEPCSISAALAADYYYVTIVPSSNSHDFLYYTGRNFDFYSKSLPVAVTNSSGTTTVLPIHSGKKPTTFITAALCFPSVGYYVIA